MSVMRQSTTLLQLQAFQTCLFLSVQLDANESVTFQQGGHMTMACFSGKGHGKNSRSPEENFPIVNFFFGRFSQFRSSIVALNVL